MSNGDNRSSLLLSFLLLQQSQHGHSTTETEQIIIRQTHWKTDHREAEESDEINGPSMRNLCQILEQCEKSDCHGLLQQMVDEWKVMSSEWWLKVLEVQPVRESEVLKPILSEMVDSIL